MIDLLPALSSTILAAGAPVTSGTAAGAPSTGTELTAVTVGITMPTFGQTLDQLLENRDVSVDRLPVPSVPDSGQKTAADGKDLPAAKTDDKDNTDDTPIDGTATPAWFPVFVVPTPLPAPVASPHETVNDAPAVGVAPTPQKLAQPLPLVVQPDATGSAARDASAGRVDTPIAASTRTQDLAILTTTDRPAPGPAPEPAPNPPADLAAGLAPKPEPESATISVAQVTLDVSRPARMRTGQTIADAGPTLATPAPIAARPVSRTPPPDADQAATPRSNVVSSLLPQALAPVGDTASDHTVAPQSVALDPSGEPSPATSQPILERAAAVRPANTIVVSTTPQPAGQVFAAAIATATSWRDRAVRNPAHDPLDAGTTLTAAPAALQERTVVHVAADAQGSALDLTQDSGLQRMIDRIETLHDDRDASDTRIRLVPDALGSVDIAVRQEGDRVHVTFTAEHDATRALLVEAQPRLTEIAAGRGVRIGETSVGGGTADATMGGNNAPPQPRPTPRLASAPRRAAADAVSTDDQRLA